MDDRIRYEACPLCDSAGISPHKVADCSRHPLYNAKLQAAMHWNSCEGCGHVFTDGYFTEEACQLIFGKTHDHQKVGGDLEKNRIVSARMIEKVLPYASEGHWLDVGFGNGSLLFTAQEFGFSPIGIDLRADTVRVMNELGITAYQRGVTDLALDEPCAVISMADVLEHIPFPKLALEAANRLLRPGGVLLISMPNSENVLWTAMTAQDVNPYWGEIEHYHNFSRTRLYSLLQEFGFAPRRYGISERYRVCMEVVALKL